MRRQITKWYSEGFDPAEDDALDLSGAVPGRDAKNASGEDDNKRTEKEDNVEKRPPALRRAGADKESEGERAPRGKAPLGEEERVYDNV